jgi:hypothetical protein
MTTTRFRDPATGRFLSAEAAARLSIPTASPDVTKPDPATKKEKKGNGKKQADKKQLAKKMGKKRTGSSKKKRKKKG